MARWKLPNNSLTHNTLNPFVVIAFLGDGAWKVVKPMNQMKNKSSILELRFGTVRILRIPEQLSGGFCQRDRLDQDQVRSLKESGYKGAWRETT